MADQKTPIPFIDLAAQRARLGKRLDEAMARVLEHGHYILGPEVTALEAELQSFTEAAHCITCANGTDALTLVLMAEGVGPGDAVIVPGFTFVATAETVAQLGATPVFADVHAGTFNLDTASLERGISAAKQNGLKPRAIIAVDLFGLPADYRVIGKTAQENELLLIADAAQSLGSAIGKRKAGTLADYTTTSFFPAKPLGCYGDGGAVFTDDEKRAELLRSLRFHGRGEQKYDNVRVGVNSRLDTLQAAILREKLTIFADELEVRDNIAMRYNSGLREHVSIPECPDGYRSSWAQYTFRLEDTPQRDAVQKRCADDGIPTAVYYPVPLHRQSGYSHFPADPDGLRISEELAGTVLSLPMHPYLDKATQDRIIDTVKSALGNRR